MFRVFLLPPFALSSDASKGDNVAEEWAVFVTDVLLSPFWLHVEVVTVLHEQACVLGIIARCEWGLVRSDRCAALSGRAPVEYRWMRGLGGGWDCALLARSLDMRGWASSIWPVRVNIVCTWSLIVDMWILIPGKP